METDNLWKAVFGLATTVAGMGLYIIWLHKRLSDKDQVLIDFHSRRADKAELLLEISAGMHDTQHGGQ